MTAMRQAGEKRKSFGTAMGVSSVIAILVILILVVFASLSAATAKADLNLSRKTAEGIEAFYAADGEAEEIYARLMTLSEDRAALRAEALSLGCEVLGNEISYEVAIDENRKLKVRLCVTPGGLARELWQTVPSGEWRAEDTVNIYTPKQG